MGIWWLVGGWAAADAPRPNSYNPQFPTNKQNKARDLSQWALTGAGVACQIRRRSRRRTPKQRGPIISRNRRDETRLRGARVLVPGSGMTKQKKRNF